MPTTEQLEEFLASAGITPSEESAEQLEMFLRALKVHAGRTQHYSRAWAQYGAMSNLLNMARKVDRLMLRHWGLGMKTTFHKDELDDAVDLLNYTGFFMRCVEEGNFVGRMPDRPDDTPFDDPHPVR